MPIAGILTYQVLISDQIELVLIQIMRKDESLNASTQVIIAALNEEQGISSTIVELKQILSNPKIIVVDGRSTDRTVEIAKYLGAYTVCQDGSGKGDAVAKAIEILDEKIDYVVLTDADYTYPAAPLVEMISLLNQNHSVGMVCGNRFSGHIDKQALRQVFYIGNRLICFAHNLFNGIQLADPLTGIRVLRTEILRGWKPRSKGFDIEVELNHLVERKGFGILEVPIEYRVRLGEKKLKARHGALIFKRIILETTY